MSRDAAERWVVIAAMVTLGIYAYRRLAEPTASPSSLRNVAGKGGPAPLGQFMIAWGFVFLVVSAMATVAPGVGGPFAALLATADFLNNGQAVFADITRAQKTGLAGGGTGLAQSILGATSTTAPSTSGGSTQPVKPHTGASGHSAAALGGG
jgi:hypothetical protein